MGGAPTEREPMTATLRLRRLLSAMVMKSSEDGVVVE